MPARFADGQGEVTFVAYNGKPDIIASVSIKDRTVRIWQPTLYASRACQM